MDFIQLLILMLKDFFERMKSIISFVNTDYFPEEGENETNSGFIIFGGGVEETY